MQFAAAIALHRLGQPLGLDTLIEALNFRLAAHPELGPMVEAALIRVGAPDAVTALLNVWNRSTVLGDDSPKIGIVCRVWSVLLDPRAL
jgi:PBS lyase HEAT-like repeat